MRSFRVSLLGVLLVSIAPVLFAAGTMFTVNSNGDQPDDTINDPADKACLTTVGTCTLRAALQQAAKTGSTGGPYTINFSAPFTITLTNGTLPDVREQTTIDGTSAPGFVAGVLMVQIDGNNAGTPGLSLSFNASNSVIKGLVIRHMSGDGIDIGVTGVLVQQCFIGTDVTGTSIDPAAGNGNKGNGIAINGTGNAIGGLTAGPLTLGGTGNVISGNTSDGILIFSVSSHLNTVRNNFIGTNVLGTAALGNGTNGVEISATGPIPGGTNLGDANVISGNANHGVFINGSDGNTVYANHIGTDITSAFALGNGGDGVHIDSSTMNLIGGPSVLQRNVISSNGNDGVEITTGANGNTVQSNFIGTNGISTGALPNTRFGVFLSSDSNQILGSLIAVRQVISGNNNDGVHLLSASTNTVEGNNIGEDGFGAPVPNVGAGVAVVSSGNGNKIDQNGIAFNGGLGIDLNADGVDFNDPGDADTGPNDLQNYPVLTSAINSGGTVTVTGTLNSLPGANYTIDLYYNDAPDSTPPPPFHGEGQTWDSKISVNTDASGNTPLPFSTPLTTNVPIGKWITATARDAAGSTSEFSVAIMVTAPPSADLSVTKVDTPDPVNAGANLTYTITLSNAGPDAASTVSLTDTLPAGTTFVSSTPAPGYSCNALTVGLGGTLTCTNPSVASGANDVFTLVVKVNSNVAAATVISNSATASSATGDPNGGNNTGSSSTTVAASSDLSVTKSGPGSAFAGTNLTYTVTMTNAGPSDAAAANVSDVVPANTTFVSATPPGGFTCIKPAVGGTGTISCTATTSLAASANAVFTFVVKVDSSAPNGVITNTATVSSTSADPDNTNNTASASTDVSASADVSITKTGLPDPVTAGTNLTYTLTVTNNGPSDAQTLTLTDVLPASETFVSQTSPGSFPCTPPVVGTNGTITCNATSLIAGASAGFTFVVHVIPSTANGATISNTATVSTATTDPTPGNNSATSTVTVAASADVSVTKIDTPDPVAPGANITYTVIVSNGGASDAQGISVTDATPANTTFVSVTAPAYSCTNPPIAGTGNINCTLATLAANTFNQITIVVNVNAATPNATVISNSATASATTADPVPGNNTGAATTTVSTVVLSADLSLTKTDAPDPVTAGMNLTYTITLSNAGPDPASTVALTDALPAGTTFVSLANPVAYTCAKPAVGTNGTILCTNPSVPMGGPDTFTVVVATDPAAGSGSTISNTATVSTTTTDPNNANDSATAVTTVATSADIAITKSDSPDPVAAGTNITYTITATNNGPSDAAAVSITDTTPANTTFVSVTPAAGFSCTNPAAGGTGAISCSGGNILTGTAPTFQIVVNVNAATPNATIITNSATFTDATTDPNPANDTGTATTTVTAAATSADLSITKTDSPDPVAAGANITYTIAVTNGGPNDATTVSMNDVVPANTTFVSVSSPVGYNCVTPAVGGTGPVTCTVPTLLNAAVSTFTITVQVGAAVGNGTVITNTASVASATSDPAPGNNSATATTTVTNVVTNVDVSVSKTALPNPVNPGGNITYTITVANAGPGAAGTVILTDATPTNTTFVSAAMPAGYTCTSPVVGGTGTITCTNLSLASGATGSFTFVVQVGAATPNATVITNTANVSTTSTDSNAGNNTATATTTVTVPVGSADLAITKTDSPDPVALGGIVTYTITVLNNGPNTATGVIVTDTLPAGASFSSASAGCTNTAGTVTCNLNSVLNAGSATVTIQAMATAGPTLTNTAQVTANQTDPNLANNSATATTTVNASANVPTASPFTLLLLALTLAAAGWFVSRK